MVMTERTYSATRLKAELLGALDDVQRSGEPIVVTKHGRPVARIVAIDEPTPMRGSVSFLVEDDALVAPIDEAWDAER